MAHLFCFGHGYVASYLSKQVHTLGWKITGTSSHNNHPSFVNITSYSCASIPADVTHMLLSIPPNMDGDIVIKDFGDMSKFPYLKWIGYLSSTGVYGNHNGDWVNENTTTTPSSTQAKQRLLAENQWLDLSNQLPIHIFRLSGIYGPGRSELDKRAITSGSVLIKPGQYFSRIHVQDIVNILLASMKLATPGEIFNLADDYPCSSQEVAEYACQLLGLSPPTPVDFNIATLSDMQRAFYNDNKRVSNNKIKTMLKVKLLFPSFREGLIAQLES